MEASKYALKRTEKNVKGNVISAGSAVVKNGSKIHI